MLYLKITHHLYRDIMGITRLQKPDKLFMDNTNLMYALVSNNTNVGSVRETFLY